MHTAIAFLAHIKLGLFFLYFFDNLERLLSSSLGLLKFIFSMIGTINDFL